MKLVVYFLCLLCLTIKFPGYLCPNSEDRESSVDSIASPNPITSHAQSSELEDAQYVFLTLSHSEYSEWIQTTGVGLIRTNSRIILKTRAKIKTNKPEPHTAVFTFFYSKDPNTNIYRSSTLSTRAEIETEYRFNLDAETNQWVYAQQIEPSGNPRIHLIQNTFFGTWTKIGRDDIKDVYFNHSKYDPKITFVFKKKENGNYLLTHIFDREQGLPYRFNQTQAPAAALTTLTKFNRPSLNLTQLKRPNEQSIKNSLATKIPKQVVNVGQQSMAFDVDDSRRIGTNWNLQDKRVFKFETSQPNFIRPVNRVQPNVKIDPNSRNMINRQLNLHQSSYYTASGPSSSVAAAATGNIGLMMNQGFGYANSQNLELSNSGDSSSASQLTTIEQFPQSRLTIKREAIPKDTIIIDDKKSSLGSIRDIPKTAGINHRNTLTANTDIGSTSSNSDFHQFTHQFKTSPRLLQKNIALADLSGSNELPARPYDSEHNDVASNQVQNDLRDNQ